MRKLILASLTISSSVAAQTPAARPRTAPLKGSLEQRLAQLIDAPPFNRATWGIYVVDDRGRVLYQRNADRFSVPASNTKLVVTAAAAVLLPADYRVTTSLYVNGRMDAGVLQGDLILYGRGDPTWSARCYAVDTLAPGVCDSTFTAIDAIADSVRAKGIRRITGKLVGDGSYFEPSPTSFPVIRRIPLARTESAIASMAVKVESHTPGASVSTAKQRADHVGSPRPYRIRSPCSTPASTRPFTYRLVVTR